LRHDPAQDGPGDDRKGDRKNGRNCITISAPAAGAIQTKELNMSTILLEAALAVSQTPESWQGTADTDTLYILIASLLLAFVAFIILMRVRW
jgi:hypothetical protein